MTTKASTTGQGSFTEKLERDTTACTDELTCLLPELMNKYDRAAVLAALCTHVSAALIGLLEVDEITEANARAVINRIQRQVLSVEATKAAQFAEVVTEIARERLRRR
jgi:hypothetical protein